MSLADELAAIDTQPPLPAASARLPIGIVGAGGIVSGCHLPAYRNAGFDVRAIYDVNPETARATAETFGIPTVSPSLEALLGEDHISIVDVAVPAVASPQIVEATLAAGKHVLTQKPLANSVAEALPLVEAARARGLLLAVNHQFRWSPSARYAIEVLRRGVLGDLVDFTIRLERLTQFSHWPWLAELDYPALWYNALHYLDATRAWFGEPSRVTARLRKHPASSIPRPTRSIVLTEYAAGGLGLIQAGHESMEAPQDWEAGFLIVGSKGQLRGRVGLMVGEEGTLSDQVELHCIVDSERVDLSMELAGSWYPDAFAGPMSSLMSAIAQGGEPETSGRDALGTLRLLEAAQASHETGVTIDMAASTQT